MTNAKHFIPNQITVFIPVYNEERFLRETLNSVLNQADCILLGDNASTDGTEAICREFAAKHECIRYIRHDTNLGAAENIVRLAKLVETEYVLQMGAHDLLPENYTATLKNQLVANPDAVCAYSDCAYINLAGKTNRVKRFDQQGTLCEGLASEDPYRRINVYLRHKMAAELLFSLFRSEAILQIIPRYLPIAGCDNLQMVQLLLLGRFVYTPGIPFQTRIAHPNDTYTEYMKRIFNAKTSRQVMKNNDMFACMRKMWEAIDEHRKTNPPDPEQKRSLRQVARYLGLKYGVPTGGLFANSIYVFGRYCKNVLKRIKFTFIPGYAARKGLSR